MWTREIVLKFYLLFFFMFNVCSVPLSSNRELTFGMPSLNVLHIDNRDQITDISEIFTPDYWFPIEINVPDTFMSAWNSIKSAWTFTSDYFTMGNITRHHYTFEYI